MPPPQWRAVGGAGGISVVAAISMSKESAGGSGWVDATGGAGG